MTIRPAARLLARHRKGAFLLALALLGAALAGTSVPPFTGSLRGFDLRDNEFYATRVLADSLFGGGATFHVMVTPRSTDAAQVFAAVAALEERIAAAYPAATTVSIAPYYRSVFARAQPPATTAEVLDAAAETPLARALVGRDRSSLLVLARFPPSEAPDPAAFDAVVAGDRQAIGVEAVLSMAHIEATIRTHVIRDFVTLSAGVILLFILFVAYLYRRAGAVVFAAANILVSVIAGLFFLSLFGVELNLVTILVVPVVVVLSLADSVHLLTGYATTRAADPEARLEEVLGRYMVPSLYSSLTTAIAFFTFYLYSDAAYIRDFGLITACALMAEFVATFLVSPFLLQVLDLRALHGFRVMVVSDFLQAHRTAFSIFFLVVLGASLLFVPRLEFRTSTDVFFPRGSALREHHDRFNEQYYSQIDFQVLVRPMPGAGFEAGAVEAYVRELADALSAQPEVRTVASTLDSLTLSGLVPMKVSAGELLGGDNPYYDEATGAHRLIVTFPAPEDIEAFYAGSFAPFRERAPPGLEVSATSTFLVMDVVNRHVAGALVKSLATAGLAIGVMILLLARSIPLALLCLIPNLVPLGIVTLVFVLLGFDINILTAMTAVVCLGLLDDDTIHILYRRVALRRPLDEVSFSILSTSGILVIGFGVFYLSSFRPIQTFGTISALVFLFGVASDLTLMPAVIDRWTRLPRAGRRRAWQVG